MKALTSAASPSSASARRVSPGPASAATSATTTR